MRQRVEQLIIGALIILTLVLIGYCLIVAQTSINDWQIGLQLLVVVISLQAVLALLLRTIYRQVLMQHSLLVSIFMFYIFSATAFVLLTTLLKMILT